VVLRVVGDGEERARLEKLSSEIGVASRVTFMGNVPNETLNREYQRADLFVLPSINASEAFGIVQAEAMSFGLPVINTNVRSSVPFVSLDGISGVTVPPKDSAGLAAAIRRFSDECGFYEKCSRNAIMRARLFSEDNMINSYVQIYKKCFGA
jgi:rhamnosyl/mannosyltransferase